MLGYLLLWLVTLAVSAASLPLTIRMLRSPEWETTSWLPSRWRYLPLLAAPVFVALAGISVVREWGYFGGNGGAPTSAEYFMMFVFLVAASLYVLFVSLYNSHLE